MNTTILDHFTETKAIMRLGYLYFPSFMFDTYVDQNST